MSFAGFSPMKLIAFLFLLLCIVSFCADMAKAAIKVRRHFDDDSRHSAVSMDSALPEASSPAKQLLAAHKHSKAMNSKLPKLDAHCWIRVERRNGEVYEAHGSCARLSKGVYACQSKTFVDPFNPYCMFMD